MDFNHERVASEMKARLGAGRQTPEAQYPVEYVQADMFTPDDAVRRQWRVCLAW